MYVCGIRQHHGHAGRPSSGRSQRQQEGDAREAEAEDQVFRKRISRQAVIARRSARKEFQQQQQQQQQQAHPGQRSRVPAAQSQGVGRVRDQEEVEAVEEGEEEEEEEGIGADEAEERFLSELHHLRAYHQVRRSEFLSSSFLVSSPLCVSHCVHPSLCQ